MELGTIITPIRKWWWLIAIATVLAGVASYLATLQEPILYQARATIMIGRVIDDPNPTNTELSLGQQLAPAYADIASRSPVREATMEALGLRQLPDYSVHSLPNTQLLEILVVDTEPERSQTVANELANQLIRLSPGTMQPDEQERQDFIEEQLDNLQLQILAAQDEISAKQSELGELQSAQQIASVQAEIQALEAKRNTLQTIYTGMLAGTGQNDLNVLTLIEPARLPQAPVASQAPVTIAMAAMLGLVLSTSAVFLVSYLDDSVESPDLISKAYGRPVLACIPEIPKKPQASMPITYLNPRAPVSEAFRGLRTSLQFAHKGSESKSILLTSANASEGKSIISANLAVVLSQAGHRVLLIDADLHAPAQYKIFGLDSKNGLAPLLSNINLNQNGHGPEKVAVEDHAHKFDDGGLMVLTHGHIPSLPADMLGSAQMKLLLQQAAEQFDYVVIDSPPMLAVTDAAILSSMVDGVLLIAERKRTRRRALKRAIERLNEAGAPVLGIVLNRMNPRSRDYGYYSYYGNYGEPPEDEIAAEEPLQA